MNNFIEITAQEFSGRPFHILEKEWTLITTQDDKKANAMTASWGGFGVLWAKPVLFTFVRPQRYTHLLLERMETYSVAVLDETHRQSLELCGTKSGRDTDKITQCGFSIAYSGGTPYLEQAHTVFICRKIAKYPLEPAGFIDPAIDAQIYPEQDYHDLYIGEVIKILAKKTDERGR
ncbi:MAG: flavin reductase family protein [Spirochaetaceae bacterium]|jgi:flavin reductase (DIM6/NTAB) family NADH-FMN oxidoreductase RutF|nr:flavin reductase family protein [Spirochaetaceae bacterium]